MTRSLVKTPHTKALVVLNELGINGLPVDPFAIATARGIKVIPKPPETQGASGMLIRIGRDFCIAYSTSLKNEGFIRFSVAHELGHYFLAGHFEKLLPADNSIHISKAGTFQKDPYERDADQFAAGLLMPEPLFAKAMENAGNGLNAIRHLADVCKTSLTATAIRYAELSEYPIAVIISSGKCIEFAVISEALEEVNGIHHFQSGEAVPPGTATAKILSKINGDTQEQLDESGDLQDWFEETRSHEVNESAIGLGSYGKVLTILDFDDPEALFEDDGFE